MSCDFSFVSDFMDLVGTPFQRRAVLNQYGIAMVVGDIFRAEILSSYYFYILLVYRSVATNL